MLTRVGNCLIDINKVAWVSKYNNQFSYELFVAFHNDKNICVIKAENPEQQEEFLNLILVASAVLPTTITWTANLPSK